MLNLNYKIRILGVLAARLLSLMLLVFSAVALASSIFTKPQAHISWGANAYNLAAVAAACIVADWLEKRWQLNGMSDKIFFV